MEEKMIRSLEGTISSQEIVYSNLDIKEMILVVDLSVHTTNSAPMLLTKDLKEDR